MAFVDSTNLKSSHIPMIRYITAVIVVTAAILFATLGVSTPHQNQAVTYAKPTFNMEAFAQEAWYPLIKDYKGKDNVITVYTLIFPDDDGKNLGQQIANAIFQSESKQMPVQVYGLNITPYLLATAVN